MRWLLAALAVAATRLVVGASVRLRLRLRDDRLPRALSGRGDRQSSATAHLSKRCRGAGSWSTRRAAGDRAGAERRVSPALPRAGMRPMGVHRRSVRSLRQRPRVPPTATPRAHARRSAVDALGGLRPGVALVAGPGAGLRRANARQLAAWPRTSRSSNRPQTTVDRAHNVKGGIHAEAHTAGDRSVPQRARAPRSHRHRAPDGSPSVVPVWFLYERGKIHITPRKHSEFGRTCGATRARRSPSTRKAGSYRKILVEGRVEFLYEDGEDDRWRDLYRRISCRYVDEASADYLHHRDDRPAARAVRDRARESQGHDVADAARG